MPFLIWSLSFLIDLVLILCIYCCLDKLRYKSTGSTSQIEILAMMNVERTVPASALPISLGPTNLYQHESSAPKAEVNDVEFYYEKTSFQTSLSTSTKNKFKFFVLYKKKKKFLDYKII